MIDSNKVQILLYNIFNNVFFRHICIYNPLIGVLWIGKCDINDHLHKNIPIIEKITQTRIIINPTYSKNDIIDIQIISGVFGNNLVDNITIKNKGLYYETNTEYENTSKFC